MSDRKSERRSTGAGTSGRPSGSSLSDAVVAALAEVERSQAELRVPADLAAATKAAQKAPSATERGDATLKMGSATPHAPDGARSSDPDKTLEDPPAAAETTSAAAPEAAARAETTSEPAPSDKEPVTAVQSVAPAAAPSAPKETPKGLAVDYFGRTDVGLVREHNEDNFLVVDLQAQKRGVGAAILHTKIEGAGTVFAVCDGMGGAAAGEVASQMAVDTIHEMMQNGGPPRDRDHFARRLVRAIEEAGSRIFAGAKMDRSRRGMGTTSTVAGLIDKTLFVGQVGDSRAYVLRGDQFALITKDQSLVNQLIEAGQLTEAEAEAFEHSNIILQALGTTEEVTVDLTFLELRRGDRLLMCSDGLSGLVHGDMIKEVMKSSRDLIECANQLIAMANAGGGHDNITVVLADFDGEDLKPSTPEDRVAYMQYPLPPEDPKDPDPAPRSTNMKSGGPKPGSDVKRDNGARSAARPRDGGNRGLLITVLLVVIVLVGLAMMLFSGGEDAPATTTHTTLSRRGTPPAAPTTNLHVLTDLEDATLFVDGVSRGALSNGMHVTVTPGDHAVEARRGTVVLARASVTSTEGAGSLVSLMEVHAPPRVDPPAPPESTSAAPTAAPTMPTGVDLPPAHVPPTSEHPATTLAP